MKKALIALAIIATLNLSSLTLSNNQIKNSLLVGANISYSDLNNKIIYFDLEKFESTLASSNEKYDYMKAAFAIQGLVNRKQPILYYKYKSNGFTFNGKQMDDAWLEQLRKDSFKGYTVETYNSFDDVIKLANDLGVIRGVVLWDNDVPATSNVANTIAGVESLVPVRYDKSQQSFYYQFVSKQKLGKIKKNLVGKFKNISYLPDAKLKAQESGIKSTGSPKNDAYLWAKKHYLDTKKARGNLMAYSQDAYVPECIDESCFVETYIPSNMEPGEEREVSITILNNSNEKWTKETNYRLASFNGNGGSNDFTITSASYGMEQQTDPKNVRVYFDSANPIDNGERVVLKFKIKAPLTTGTYHLNLGVIHDGVRWLKGNVNYKISVQNISTINEMKVGLTNKCNTEACFFESYLPKKLEVNEEREVYITILNNSKEKWSFQDKYRLAAIHGSNDFTVTRANYGMEQQKDPKNVRVYLNKSNPIDNGERVRLKFKIKAPSTSGIYHLNLKVVHDGVRWLSGNFDHEIEVLPNKNKTKNDFKNCSDELCIINTSLPTNLKPNEEREVYITLLNNSKETWKRDSKYRIAAINESNDFTITSAEHGVEKQNDPANVRLYLNKSNPIANGERVKIKFKIKAPATSGIYHLNLGVVHDGVRWLKGSLNSKIEVVEKKNRKLEYYGTYTYGMFNTGLNSSDYLIQRKAFFFDLSPDETIAPIDDRNQKIGTDVETLNALLKQEKANNNNFIFTVSGFVPWFRKYSSSSDNQSKLGAVAAEWKMIEILSKYGGQTDADAISPLGLTNASIFFHVKLNDNLKQKNNKEDLKLGKVNKTYNSKTKYFMIFMGDYDGSSWTSGVLPSKFAYSEGTTDKYPLAWAINADLSRRIPHVFNWLYQEMRGNDYFVAGDNGTGYLNPMVTDDLNRWRDHNYLVNQKFDIDVTGFLIGGDYTITKNVQKAYVKMTPTLVGYYPSDKGIESSKIGNTPFIPVYSGAGGNDSSSDDVANRLYNILTSQNKRYVGIRTVQMSRKTIYEAIDKLYIKARENGVKLEIVDPYTLAFFYNRYGK